MMDMTLLQSHLNLCVPLAIANLKQQGGATDWHVQEAQRRAKELRETDSGDEGLMFALPTTQQAITTLVEILAVMAFQPGGVDAFDLHFEAILHGWSKEVQHGNTTTIPAGLVWQPDTGEAC